MAIKKLHRFRNLFLGACMVITGLTPATRATTINVTSTANSGPGTLRDALANAANGDTINITANGTLLLIGGELLVSNSVAITGPGAAKFAVDGNESHRGFHITPGFVVSISGLTITNTQDISDTGGGAIYNHRSNLTLSNCVLTGNSALSVGGAIYNHGASTTASVAIVNCTISGNRAGNGGAVFNDGGGGVALMTVSGSRIIANEATRVQGSGGGVYNFGDFGSVTLEISTSTLSSNVAPFGGGAIFTEALQGKLNVRISQTTIADNSGGGLRGGGIYFNTFQGKQNLQLANSTISGNSAELEGGGLYIDAPQSTSSVQIASCTFSDNSAAAGGAIYQNALNLITTLEIGNTILKAGTSGGTISNSNGLVISQGYNLSSDGGGDVLNTATDQTNTDPLLGQLQDNGGPTFTHPLQAGSPAIDKGKRDAVAALSVGIDQRGEPRPFDDPNVSNASGGDGSDIGAYEASQLRITAVDKFGNDLRLSFTSVLDADYVVHSRSDLDTGNWTDLPGFVAGNGGIVTTTQTNALSQAKQFYRIQLQP